MEIEELYGVIGSSLLEKVFHQAEGGKLKIEQAIAVCPNIVLVTADGRNENFFLNGITGKMTGGEKAIDFQGNLPKSPLKVGLAVRDGLPSLKAIKVSFGLDFKSWE